MRGNTAGTFDIGEESGWLMYMNKVANNAQIIRIIKIYPESITKYCKGFRIDLNFLAVFSIAFNPRLVR